MNIKQYKDDVFSISDVISKEDSEKVIKYLEFLADSNILKWNQISFYDSYAMGFWESDERLLAFGLPSDFFNTFKNKIKEVSEKAIGTELSEVSYHAQKWIEGAFASFHSDNSDEDGNPTAFERSKYAAFVYLNDDFTGGKLNFEHHDISIQPEAGMLAVFAGGHGNEHEVTKVKSGTRYTIGSFWDRADSVYSEEQRQAWADELAEVRRIQEEEYKVWQENKKNGIIADYVGKNGE